MATPIIIVSLLLPPPPPAFSRMFFLLGHGLVVSLGLVCVESAGVVSCGGNSGGISVGFEVCRSANIRRKQNSRSSAPVPQGFEVLRLQQGGCPSHELRYQQ